MHKLLLLPFLFFVSQFLLGQSIATKKVLGHEDLVSWNKIQRPQISNDGKWVVYTLQAEEGDPTLKIYDAQANKLTSFERSDKAQISEDNRFVVFKIHPAKDTIKALRRQKVDKKELPKSHLGIYNLEKGTLDTIYRVKNYKMPKKWAGWIAYLQEEKHPKVKTDTTKAAKTRKKSKKKSSKKPSLHILNLTSSEEKAFPNVSHYDWAEEGKRLAFSTTSNDSILLQGVYLFDSNTNTHRSIWQQKGEYKNLVFDKPGNQLAFHANFDTTEATLPPFELLYWKEGKSTATSDGTKLFWGIAPTPVQQDTSLLEEEIVNVEVWHWQDAKLHTQQKVQKDREAKRAYTVVWNPATNKFIQLGTLEMPETRWGNKGNAKEVLAYNENPYYKKVSWEGGPAGRDVYIVIVQWKSYAIDPQ